MAGIRQHQESPAIVKADGHHGGVVDAVEVFHDRLVEISHETRLLESRKVLLHQLPKLRTEGDDGTPVATHISQGDARYDAAWTH
jgi:hypothetical protein